jgi:hypothetical protein
VWHVRESGWTSGVKKPLKTAALIFGLIVLTIHNVRNISLAATEVTHQQHP